MTAGVTAGICPRDIGCEACGAKPGEECFGQAIHVWGGNEYHHTRIYAFKVWVRDNGRSEKLILRWPCGPDEFEHLNTGDLLKLHTAPGTSLSGTVVMVFSEEVLIQVDCAIVGIEIAGQRANTT